MVNPFLFVRDEKLKLNTEAQGRGLQFSHLYCLLSAGAALHAADPTAWQSSSVTAGDEVLHRLRALGLADTFAYKQTEAFFREAKV